MEVPSSPGILFGNFKDLEVDSDSILQLSQLDPLLISRILVSKDTLFLKCIKD